MFYKQFLMFTFVVFGLMIWAGCSDSGTNPANDEWSQADFADYEEIMEEIAPPPYEEPVASSGAIDPMWTGTFLKKVFSEDEPMSLYANLATFQETIDNLKQFLLVDSNMNFMLDTAASDINDWATLTELTDPTSIPAELQAVFGEEISLDYLVSVDFPGTDTGWVNHIAFSFSDTTQDIMVYMQRTEEAPIEISYLYYAHFNAEDSTIDMRGVVYKDYGDGTAASWSYLIDSDELENFAYRMSWYAALEEEETDLLGCIIGGGNRDEEFALSYREYKPADSSDYFAGLSQEEVFALDGLEYVEGTGLITAFEDYVDEALFITYDDMPQALFSSPFED